VKNEVNSATEENPTVNKTNLMMIHNNGVGFSIMAKARKIQIADGMIIPAYKMFIAQNP
jgi:lipoprotein signal peptidase